jgi:transposase InsO family protein
MAPAGRPAPPEPSSDHRHRNYTPVISRSRTQLPQALTRYNSDRGCQYTGGDFAELARANGVVPSVGSKGDCLLRSRKITIRDLACRLR